MMSIRDVLYFGSKRVGVNVSIETKYNGIDNKYFNRIKRFFLRSNFDIH